MNTIIINGSAGTGKSTLIKEILKKYNTAKRGYHVRAGSTTWVSASIFNGKSFWNRLRLQPLIEDQPSSKSIFNAKPKPKSKMPIIIDEASMLSQEYLNELERIFPNAPILLFGDWNQMHPVEGTPIDITKYPTITLGVNHRSKDTRLLALLDDILNNRWGKVNQIIEQKKADERKGIMACFTNRAVKQWNREIKWVNGELVIFSKTKYMDEEDVLLPYNIKREKEGLPPKSKIPVTCSNKELQNNYMFRIKDRKNFILENEITEELTTLSPEDRRFFDAASSLTIHRLQGQTIKDQVTVNLADMKLFCWDPDQYKRLLYVACSRATSLDNLHFYGTLNIPSRAPIYNISASTLDSFEVINQINEVGLKKWIDNIILEFKNKDDPEFATPTEILAKGTCARIEEKMANRESLLQVSKRLNIPYTTLKRKIKNGSIILKDPEVEPEAKPEEKPAVPAVKTEKPKKSRVKVSQKDTVWTPQKPVQDQLGGTPVVVLKKNDGQFAHIVANSSHKDSWNLETINKIDPTSGTTGDNKVLSMQNFLFEIDDLTLDRQLEIIQPLIDEGIVNRVVFSGNKSYHCRITVGNMTITSKEQYKLIWHYLNSLCFHGCADSQCAHPSRTTRAPGRHRNRWESNANAKQSWIYLSQSKVDIDPDDLERFELCSVMIIPTIPVKYTTNNTSKISMLGRALLNGDENTLEGGNGWVSNMCKAAINLKYNGYALSEILQLGESLAHNDNDRHTNRNLITSAWNFKR